MLIDELLLYLFDGQPHPLTTPMATWLTSSRRFTTFATTFRNKIRKKLRVTQDEETLYDLQLELETAYLLLQERSLNVVYEPQQPGQTRCPDFAVTYTTRLTFMVEVTRLRAVQKRTPADAQAQTLTASDNVLPFPLQGEQVAETICTKLGQLLPQRNNILIIGADTLSLTQSDLNAAMLRVQQRAERNDPAFWQRHWFRDRADFFHHYYRLSEVFLRESQMQAEKPVVTWVNPQAKYPLPSQVRTALYHSHSAGIISY